MWYCATRIESTGAMCDKKLVAYLLYHMLTSISLAIAQICFPTGNFTANSTYAKNRDLILASLASNVTLNGGFYHTTIGQGPDQVYGLALCRGDSTSEICAECVNTTIHDIIAKCPYQKEVLWWRPDPPCMIRYANRSISGKLELIPADVLYNVNNMTSNFTEFYQIFQNLTDGLVKKASMGNSSLKFATGEASLIYNKKIYALMQCTPDLSQIDCDICLRQNVANFQGCWHERQGSHIQRPSCIFRWELYPFYNTSMDNALLPSPPPQANTTITETKGGGGTASHTPVIIIVSTVTSMVLVACTCVFLGWRKHDKRSKDKRNNLQLLEASLLSAVESLQFDFSAIRVATNNFSMDNKLGQGGFGAVFKRKLLDGREIAVKRLSKNSGQGELEFKNEVLLMAKLQHRNLVRLLGFCLEVNERLLIYEFVPNSSLYDFIFDPTKRSLLNWELCYKIILGIARGMVYLHEDSRLRVIHRDLKASNILLNTDMNPKISDFGMAKLFEMNQTESDTNRIVGTFGYMAPEYIKCGQFSVKSDVFSFGVLLLEIISGKKNRCFRNGEEADDFLTYAWKNWKAGTAFNLIDNLLRVGSTSHEILKCIHIGLLCVQEIVTNRPTMTSVVLMLTSSSISLPLPSEPAFYMHTNNQLDNLQSTMCGQSKTSPVLFSVNNVSITQMDPR